ncbi:MAG: hypothetical protein WCA39_10115 [Nitrososphaeraceae archaeon]
MARAYALTVHCAAACAPFKSSSPYTYATCCKQHATAPKPPIKPAAVKPAVLKSRFPKPLTTGPVNLLESVFEQ